MTKITKANAFSTPTGYHITISAESTECVWLNDLFHTHFKGRTIRINLLSIQTDGNIFTFEGNVLGIKDLLPFDLRKLVGLPLFKTQPNFFFDLKESSK